MASTSEIQAILDAIDAAILAGVSKPGEIDVANRRIKYRDLKDLMDTRKMYQTLLQASRSGGRGMTISRTKSGNSYG